MHCVDVRETSNQDNVAVIFGLGGTSEVRDMKMTASGATTTIYQIGSQAHISKSCFSSHFYESGDKFVVGCSNTTPATAASATFYEVKSSSAPDIEDSMGDWNITYIPSPGASPNPIKGVKSITRIPGENNASGYFFAIVSTDQILYYCSENQGSQRFDC